DRAGRDVLAAARGADRGGIFLDRLDLAVDLLDEPALAAVVDLRLVLRLVEVRERRGELVILAQLALADRLEIEPVLDDVRREHDEEVGLLLLLGRVLEEIAEDRDVAQ